MGRACIALLLWELLRLRLPEVGAKRTGDGIEARGHNTCVTSVAEAKSTTQHMRAHCHRFDRDLNARCALGLLFLEFGYMQVWT